MVVRRFDKETPIPYGYSTRYDYCYFLGFL
jgi:hypothetical protein